MMKDYIRINEKDNTLIALKELKQGTVLIDSGKEIELLENIKPGHKIATVDIYQGENIIKYGYPIGHAVKNIEKGRWIHTHNIKTNLDGTLDYKYNPINMEVKRIGKTPEFNGYKRKNGDVGIRNELWIVPTVGCVNGTAEIIANRLKAENDLGQIDGIHVYKHNYGCSQLGDDFENTRTILLDLVKHPNAGGVLVLGLGCENNTIEDFIVELGEYDKERIKFLKTQAVGNEIEKGVNILKEILEVINEDSRENMPISELKVGLKCGGSDGFSGITANPLLGAFSDYLINHGGTTILTEVPEMFGAETILMDRAESESVFDNIVNLINDFKQYFIQHGQPIYENPSPGNKEGGISTLEDKSLGCTQKGGESKVVDVLRYGEIVKKKGLNLLNAPGNDLVASTALGASGCHIVLFTTGRGTPFGSFVPTVKVSSNSEIFKLKPHWIDFNAGVLLEDIPMETLLNNFIEYLIKVASGEYVNNEKNGIKEIAIYKTGVTL
ncbi:UxaA family hydrolase [Serpentinicella alkaliphila]|uniref:D-altronate dehydratase n=1 Tax=Serpentinicella alkaliphila TaxID=1734049 RepID=A0A4R2UJQ9_9FIRM|nr:D-altronate dehydratase [Serpentinicella alkaliphila]